ncbi:MAG: hypothetical protein Q4D53_06130 [Leptotrichiaceae bacterium]|nr:hypothetical protein [Leptotrichiaceae bacterium]
MRKIKKEKTEIPNNMKKHSDPTDNDFHNTDIMKQIKFILLVSWIFPFFGLSFLHFVRKTLHEKPKKILCKILNMEFTSILILFIMVSLLNTLALAKVNGIFIFIFVIFILLILTYSVISHIIGTLKWLKGEDYSFKFSAEFFKPYKNIPKE